MNIITSLILLATFETILCQDIKEIFENINKKTEHYKALAAEIAWESSVNPGNQTHSYKSAIFQKERIEWQQGTCDELAILETRHLFNSTQLRQKYLLCRGPKYTYNEARLVSKLYEELQTIYTEAEVCIPTADNNSSINLNEVETAILKYLTPATNFLKRVYHSKDSTLYATKKAGNYKIGEDRGVCLKGEDDFQKLMAFSRNEEVLQWLWLVWREKVGPPMKAPYSTLVEVETAAAKRNGYLDIGIAWREEQEIPNLRQKCRRLYEGVRPLYTLLHGIVRFFLRQEYGEVVPETGPIPAHLLGNLWSQNWEPLADLIIPKTIDLDERITKLNWTVEHMVKRAEDFYQSLGLPPMTDIFWKKSVFKRANQRTRCHGAAADMFRSGDFRLLYCSGTTKEDFYVLHHELGHIQYYMAYVQQPALFRQANTAFHEAIGDTITLGVFTPQHLHRLGLINDSLLYSRNYIQKEESTEKKEISSYQNIKNGIFTKKCNQCSGGKAKYNKNYFSDEHFNKDIENENVYITTDDILLLKQALNKIPQIPFSLLVDEYRWKYFEGDISTLDMNKAFWQMALDFQGIAPPIKRGEDDFDAAAKFHVPDHTPYIRYFLSSFLQHQLFESLCKAAVFGRRGVKSPLPDTITMNRCDIYGSKTAGKLLKDLMSRGHSQHWQQILQETTGQDRISSVPLRRYYRPLYKLLKKLVRLHHIPIGW